MIDREALLNLNLEKTRPTGLFCLMGELTQKKGGVVEELEELGNTP